MKELSNNQRLLCSIIYPAAAMHMPPPEPVALGQHQLQTPARHSSSPPPAPRASCSPGRQAAVQGSSKHPPPLPSTQIPRMAGKPTPCTVQREQIGSADTRDPLAQHGGVAGHSPRMHSPGVPCRSERTPAFCRASAPSFTSAATASPREPRCGSCRTEASGSMHQLAGPPFSS